MIIVQGELLTIEEILALSDIVNSAPTSHYDKGVEIDLRRRRMVAQVAIQKLKRNINTERR